MGHEVMIAQLDVLQVHALEEIGQPPGRVDLDAAGGGGRCVGVHGRRGVVLGQSVQGF